MALKEVFNSLSGGKKTDKVKLTLDSVYENGLEEDIIDAYTKVANADDYCSLLSDIGLSNEEINDIISGDEEIIKDITGDEDISVYVSSNIETNTFENDVYNSFSYYIKKNGDKYEIITE